MVEKKKTTAKPSLKTEVAKDETNENTTIILYDERGFQNH